MQRSISVAVNNHCALFWSIWHIERLLKRLNKERWNIVRKQALDIYGAVCHKCGATTKINVDHIKPKSKYPELRFDINNLQILCWPCNKEKSNKDETDYRPLRSSQ